MYHCSPLWKIKRWRFFFAVVLPSLLLFFIGLCYVSWSFFYRSYVFIFFVSFRPSCVGTLLSKIFSAKFNYARNDDLLVQVDGFCSVFAYFKEVLFVRCDTQTPVMFVRCGLLIEKKKTGYPWRTGRMKGEWAMYFENGDKNMIS